LPRSLELSFSAAMPKPRPPYLHRRISRHGKVTWYVWKRPGPKIRIRGEYDAPEFKDAYAAALAGRARQRDERGKPSSETLAWLIARYRESAAWAELSAATRRQRDNIFKRVAETAGSIPYASLTRADITATRDKKRDTPAAANNFLGTMRGLYQWAVESGFVDTDPTAGVKGVTLRGSGFHQWTEDEIQRFETRWPIGTRERLALAVLLYTGLRRGDAARLGRQHIRNGVIQLRTEKTGTPVAIPVLSVLQHIIDRSPIGHLALIARHDGQPMTKEGFGNWFKKAAMAAGVPGSCHGLRKAGATRAAEAGATVHELNAIFGWSGTRMASLYTEKADRARLARAAIAKLNKNEP
jgi:integrase